MFVRRLTFASFLSKSLKEETTEGSGQPSVAQALNFQPEGFGVDLKPKANTVLAIRMLTFKFLSLVTEYSMVKSLSETLRERVGKFLIGPEYSPDKTVRAQIAELIREPVEVPALTEEELEFLSEEEKKLSVKEQREILRRIEEERREPEFHSSNGEPQQPRELREPQFR